MSGETSAVYIVLATFGILLGSPIAFLLYWLARKQSAGAKLILAAVLTGLAVIVLAALAFHEERSGNAHDPNAFWQDLTLPYSLIITIIAPFDLSAGFWFLEFKRVVLSPGRRLALKLGGCGLAIIGYFLPWYQDYAFGTPATLKVFNGATLDANPPYYITIVPVGNYPYALLFTLIAVALVSLFSYYRNRYSVFVQFFGRSLHIMQTIFLFVAAGLVGSLSISGRNGSLLWGFWLTVVGFLLTLIGEHWPQFDTAKPNVWITLLLSVVVLGVSIFEFRVGSAQVSQAIVKALGGGTVATVCAAFASDLLGPAWLAAAIGVVAAWIAVRRDDKALATQTLP